MKGFLVEAGNWPGGESANKPLGAAEAVDVPGVELRPNRELPLVFARDEKISFLAGAGEFASPGSKTPAVVVILEKEEAEGAVVQVWGLGGSRQC